MNDFYPKSEIEIPNQKTGQPTEPFTSISTPASLTRLPEVGMHISHGLVMAMVIAALWLGLAYRLYRLDPGEDCDKVKAGYTHCRHRPGECDKGVK